MAIFIFSHSSYKNPLGLVVVTYNSENEISALVESALLHIPSVQEIVIVDNCSEDATVKVSEELKEKYRNIKLIRKRENVGLGRGLTIGISAINCDYVLVTNPDIIIQEGNFSSFLELMTDGRVGIVVPGRWF